VAGGLIDLEEVLAEKTRRFGSDHPSTLRTRHEIASLRAASGDITGGLSLLEEVLADRVRVLGSDSPDTLSTRHQIAHWRVESGDIAGGVIGFEDVLADLERVLGVSHPSTVFTRRSLDAAYRRRAGATIRVQPGPLLVPYGYAELMGPVGIQFDMDDETETSGVVV
jgi:hypothetical protein